MGTETMKDILENLQIKLDDTDENANAEEGKVDVNNIDLEKVPEDQRPMVKALIDQSSEFKNTVAKNEIVINTLRDEAEKVIDKFSNMQTNDSNEDISKPKEGIFGLDPDDKYIPAFKAIAEGLSGIHAKEVENVEKAFEANVAKFVGDNKDMVRYVKTMDKIRDELRPESPFRYDVQYLYGIAKSMEGNSDTKVQDKGNELNNNQNALNFTSERPGMAPSNVTSPTNAKTINEAFELAIK